MNCQEKQPLLQDKVGISDKADIPKEHASPKHKWRTLITLLIIVYLLIEGGAIMSYLLNEWIQHTLKVKLLTKVNVTLDTSGCSDLNKSSELYKNFTKVQQSSAQWIMYNSMASYVPAFFSSLILSAYTDKYGRKFVIILTLFGVLVTKAVTLAVIITNQSFIYIVASYLFEGFTGAFYAFYSATFSIIADLIKDKKNRVLAVVAVEFVTMFAATVSGFLSGILVESLGFVYPTVICTGFILLAFILAILFLPETLQKENRSNPGSVLGILKRPVEFYTSSEFKGKRLTYSLFLLAFGVAELAGLNRTSLETIYLLGAPFCWSPTKIGYFTSIRHFGQAVVGLGSVKLMQKCWSNEFIAILSTVSSIASYVVEGFATTELMMLMVAVIAVFSFLTIPMIRGIMSTLTPADKQGSMFASLAAIQVLGSIIAVTSENSIYSATVSIMTGFVFLVMAGFCTIEFVLLIFGTILGRRQSKPGTVTYITDDLIEEYRSTESTDSSQLNKTVDNKADGLYKRDSNTSKKI